MESLFGPLPYHNPCRIREIDDTLIDAPYSICGGYGGGGGVLFWAYSIEEAQEMVSFMKAHGGYSRLRIIDESTGREPGVPAYKDCVLW